MLPSLQMRSTTSLTENFPPGALYLVNNEEQLLQKNILEIWPVKHFQLVMIFHHYASKTDKPASCMLDAWINGCTHLLNCSNEPRQGIKGDQHTSHS